MTHQDLAGVAEAKKSPDPPGAVGGVNIGNLSDSEDDASYEPIYFRFVDGFGVVHQICINAMGDYAIVDDNKHHIRFLDDDEVPLAEMQRLGYRGTVLFQDDDVDLVQEEEDSKPKARGPKKSKKKVAFRSPIKKVEKGVLFRSPINFEVQEDDGNAYKTPNKKTKTRRPATAPSRPAAPSHNYGTRAARSARKRSNEYGEG